MFVCGGKKNLALEKAPRIILQLWQESLKQMLCWEDQVSTFSVEHIKLSEGHFYNKVTAKFYSNIGCFIKEWTKALRCKII